MMIREPVLKEWMAPVEHKKTWGLEVRGGMMQRVQEELANQ
jgi:hypothetical protein